MLNDYGTVIYNGSGIASDEMLNAIVKTRYDFDLSQLSTGNSPLF